MYIVFIYKYIQFRYINVIILGGSLWSIHVFSWCTETLSVPAGRGCVGERESQGLLGAQRGLSRGKAGANSKIQAQRSGHAAIQPAGMRAERALLLLSPIRETSIINLLSAWNRLSEIFAF